MSSFFDDGDSPSGTAEDSLLAHQENEGQNDIPEAFCSVLNTVVDHIMIPPTPLEPKEYRSFLDEQETKHETGKDSSTSPPAKRNLQVPVLRIFGPILRRDTSKTILEPAQSACLYIHGAFPYLLARPVLAGPDGSLHRSSHLQQQSGLTPTGHVDWDDVESVQRILPVLQENLEASIQSSLQEFASTNSNSNPKPPAVSTSRVIRQMTVVVGRGFYTYCPGPPASFVRVEYYDPKLRWKVKRILERGLDLPSLYHPDPVQYDAAAKQSAIVEDDSAEALTFHCYEAHIPLTMQFFKDYNLAGMSYIHVAKPNFRRPLPHSIRQRWSHDKKEDDTVATETLFLDSNIPAGYIWPSGREARAAGDGSSWNSS